MHSTQRPRLAAGLDSVIRPPQPPNLVLNANLSVYEITVWNGRHLMMPGKE